MRGRFKESSALQEWRHSWLILRYLFHFSQASFSLSIFFSCFSNSLSRPKSSTRHTACVIRSNAYFKSKNSCSAQSSTRLHSIVPSHLSQKFCSNMMKRHLSQFSENVQKMFNSLQEDSAKCTEQYELNSFVTMATCILAFRPAQC